MAYGPEDLLQHLAASGVTCDDGSDGGWVDDTADAILRALFAAGWEPPLPGVPVAVQEPNTTEENL